MTIQNPEYDPRKDIYTGDQRDSVIHSKAYDPRTKEHTDWSFGPHLDPRDPVSHHDNYDPREISTTTSDPRDPTTLEPGYDPRVFYSLVSIPVDYIGARPAAPDRRDPAIHHYTYDPRPQWVDRRSYEHRDYDYDPRPEWTDRRSEEHTKFHTVDYIPQLNDPRPAWNDPRPAHPDRRLPYTPPAREVKDYRRPLGYDPRRPYIH